MRTAKRKFVLVECEEYLYAVRGFDKYVERFSAFDGVWEYVLN